MKQPPFNIILLGDPAFRRSEATKRASPIIFGVPSNRIPRDAGTRKTFSCRISRTIRVGVSLPFAVNPV